MVNESQGSDKVVQPKGDATPDSPAATLSQKTWEQMDTAGSLGPASRTIDEPPSLAFDNSIYRSDQVALTNKLLSPAPERTDAPDKPLTGAIETKDLQPLTREGIDATKDIALDPSTSDRDRYRSLQVLLSNDVNKFENDGQQYEIQTSSNLDKRQISLMRENPDSTMHDVWSADDSVLKPGFEAVRNEIPTRSIVRPGDEKVPPGTPPDERLAPKVPGDPVTPPERALPGDPATPQDRTNPREDLRPQDNQPEKTKEQKLFDPSLSPEEKIKIAKELNQEGKSKITGPDGKTYDISVQKVGNRELVAVMGKDEKGHSKPLLRGIVEKDGTVSKQRNSKGQFVDFQSDWAKKNAPDNPLVKHEPKQPDQPTPARPEQPPEADPEKPPVNPVLPEQPVKPETPPVNPEDPAKPEKPPVNPEEPTKPEKPPVNPEEPTKPERPPVNPEDPAKPEKPPANPEEPAKPDKPQTPERPPETQERPEQTDRPPEVEESRKRLRESAEKSITDPQARQKFLDDMDTFEKRAREQGISPQEVARTMDQTRRLLDAPQGATSAENRILAARGLAHHLANPSDTNQGAHNTCGPTSLGERTLTRNPSRAAEMVASAAIDGQWTSSDGKVIKIPPGNLTPGAEERTFPPTGDHRTFATQLMNATIINDVTQHRMPPEYYVQGRPTGDGDTGERVYYDGQKPEDGRRYNGHTGPELAEEARRLNGDRNAVLQDPATDSGADVVPIRNEQDLKNALEAAKRNGNMPLIVFLDAADPSINGNGTGPRRFHFVSITGYDANTGQVTVSNQWGPQHDKQIPASDLYRAIKRREV